MTIRKTPETTLFGACSRLLIGIVALLFSVQFLAAQSAGTGIVTGRIFNPVTQEYVRDAEVSVKGTNLLTASGDGGYYTMSGVPAGQQTLVVTYSGYGTTNQNITVVAGTSVNQELMLTPPPGATRSSTDGEETILLETFTVSAEAEGNAKSIMNQRNSMSLGTSISSDVFGEVTEGNVGEFLKYLPGIEMEYVEADTRGPRLGGMDPEYTGVSLDGMKSASADGFAVYGGTENGGGGSGARSFSFEQVSINSIESIEIHRVTPPDLDADAPAGTIDMKSKRAFDTKGRLFRWSLSGGLNSEEFTLSRTAGPDDAYGRKVRPSASLNYSESFLNNRLGFQIGLSTSNLYNEQQRVENTYGTSGGNRIVTQVAFKDGPKWTERRTGTITVDYKATRRLVLSLTAMRTYYEMYAYNRISTLNFGSSQGASANLTNARSTTATLQNGGGNINKITNGVTVTPKFEYRLNTLTIDGTAHISASKNTYGTLRRGLAGNAQTNNITGISVEASRSDMGSSDWRVRQTGGPDWSDLANYRNPRVTDDTRYVYAEIRNAALNARWVTPFAWPTFFKAGFKLQERLHHSDRTGTLNTYNYIGPGGGTTGSFAAYPSPFEFAPTALGVSFTSLNGGGGPAYANRNTTGELFRSNPEYFTNNPTAANWYSAKYADRQRLKETIPSVYLMGNTRIARLQLQGGIRMEKTMTESEEFDPLTPSQVIAAGYTANAGTGQATTIPGLIYQFESRPKVLRKGDYTNFFPSLSGKYRITSDFIVDAGYGKSIRRPNLNNITGLFEYDEINREVEVANPNLKPEESDRYALNASYYLPSAGSLGLTLSETHIEKLTDTTEFTAAEFGITDPALADYTVITRTQGEGKRRFRSMEINYRQRLRMLPGALRGTTVFATYTRTYATERRRGMTPHTLTGGFDFKYKKFGFGLKGIWQDEAPWSNATRYRPEVFKVDGSLDFELTRWATFFVQARNISNQDHIVKEADGRLWRAENYGSNWVFGLRGRF